MSPDGITTFPYGISAGIYANKSYYLMYQESVNSKHQ